jgi:hypothetical protein
VEENFNNELAGIWNLFLLFVFFFFFDLSSLGKTNPADTLIFEPISFVILNKYFKISVQLISLFLKKQSFY